MSKQLSIVNIVCYEYDSSSVFAEHMHPDIFQVYFVYKGESRYIVDGKEYLVKKDQFILIPMLSAHEMIQGECDDYAVLDFKFIVHDRQLAEKLNRICLFYEKQDRCTQLFQMILEEIKNRETLYDKIVYLHFEAIIYLLTRANRTIPDSRSEVIYIDRKKLGPCSKKVLIALEGTLIASPNSNRIDEIAKSIGYNKQYMCKTFSAEVGISPMKFQQLLRLDKAKEMLEATNYNISEIAVLLGYPNHSYFIKVFKKNVGMTPLQYRKRGEKHYKRIRYESGNNELIL